MLPADMKRTLALFTHAVDLPNLRKVIDDAKEDLETITWMQKEQRREIINWSNDPANDLFHTLDGIAEVLRDKIAGQSTTALGCSLQIVTNQLRMIGKATQTCMKNIIEDAQTRANGIIEDAQAHAKVLIETTKKQNQETQEQWVAAMSQFEQSLSAPKRRRLEDYEPAVFEAFLHVKRVIFDRMGINSLSANHLNRALQPLGPNFVEKTKDLNGIAGYDELTNIVDMPDASIEALVGMKELAPTGGRREWYDPLQ
ncbi:hypothetical protein PT974_02709 [Cladobotryum mycophilum]|uniref:Uncharacterized protein n=1 Tax=Cladobotryum mycophilum TaxID=491253 RepID=A0ABR0SYZ3_9HYPO